jgi:hypothetical protein
MGFLKKIHCNGNPVEFCTLVWLIFSKKNGHKESQPAKKKEVA